jgi:hypothetical protein
VVSKGKIRVTSGGEIDEPAAFIPPVR